jgi:hypothetical protein
LSSSNRTIADTLSSGDGAPREFAIERPDDKTTLAGDSLGNMSPGRWGIDRGKTVGYG